MHQSQEQRNTELKRYRQLLSTENGQLLLTELELVWDQFGLIGENPQSTAYNCGMRDAFKFLQQLQRGDLLHA